MADVSSLVEEINNSLPTLKRGSLVVFGDIFGGRIDNIHRVVGAEETGSPSRLVVRFHEGETLEIYEPDGTEFSSTTFRIGIAARVHWDWFYYGRPKTTDNRFFIDHLVVGERVIATTNVDFATMAFAPSIQSYAVELLL